MSELEKALRDICADPMLDMISLIRTPSGGWQASVKRAYRGHNVHHDADPVTALMKALTAPALAPIKAAPPAPAAPAAPPTPAVDDDLFG